MIRGQMYDRDSLGMCQEGVGGGGGNSESESRIKGGQRFIKDRLIEIGRLRVNLTRPFFHVPCTTHEICSLPTYNTLLYIVQAEAAFMHVFGTKENERKFCISTLIGFTLKIINHRKMENINSPKLMVILSVFSNSKCFCNLFSRKM